MTSEYTIEFLVETFSKHSEEYEKQKKDFLEKKGDPTFDESFNLPQALLTFAKEIKSIKEKK